MFAVANQANGLPGLSYADASEKFTGLDMDVYLVVTVVVFSDTTKVKFTPLTTKEHFTALQSGKVDILSENTTWIPSSNGKIGFVFAGVHHCYGIVFLTHNKANLKSAKCLDSATICLQSSTDTESIVADFFSGNKM